LVKTGKMSLAGLKKQFNKANQVCFQSSVFVFVPLSII